MDEGGVDRVYVLNLVLRYAHKQAFRLFLVFSLPLALISRIVLLNGGFSREYLIMFQGILCCSPKLSSDVPGP